MRLISFGPPGAERPGLQRPEGIIDLRRHFPSIPDIGPEFFRQGWPEKLKDFDAPAEPFSGRLGAPVLRPAKIICLGKNFAAHADEGGFDLPEQPLLFCKTPNTVNGPFDDVLLPESSGQVDWEVELAVVIAKAGKGIDRHSAMEHVAGYMVMNDVSARQAQFGHSQWFRGKSFDTFAPMGPALVTADEIQDIRNLRLTARVNGVLMQDGNTADMIFSVPEIIEDISRDITLWPGDIISTGTPAGVGIFRDPPVTLAPGDVVECSIESVGTIRNRFVTG